MSAPCRYHQVFERQIRKCHTCNQPIAFVQNVKGKWYPVDVFPYAPVGGFAYRTGMGAFGNHTPWHKCIRRKERELL